MPPFLGECGDLGGGGGGGEELSTLSSHYIRSTRRKSKREMACTSALYYSFLNKTIITSIFGKYPFLWSRFHAAELEGALHDWFIVNWPINANFIHGLSHSPKTPVIAVSFTNGPIDRDVQKIRLFFSLPSVCNTVDPRYPSSEIKKVPVNGSSISGRSKHWNNPKRKMGWGMNGSNMHTSKLNKYTVFKLDWRKGNKSQRLHGC